MRFFSPNALYHLLGVMGPCLVSWPKEHQGSEEEVCDGGGSTSLSKSNNMPMKALRELSLLGEVDLSPVRKTL